MNKRWYVFSKFYFILSNYMKLPFEKKKVHRNRSTGSLVICKKLLSVLTNSARNSYVKHSCPTVFHAFLAINGVQFLVNN